jgi:hypothetical protein
MKKLATILITMCVMATGLAQQKGKNTFTFTTGKYTDELGAFFDQDKGADKAQQQAYAKLVSEYLGVWSELTPDMKTKVVGISNQMIKAKAKPSDIADFVTVQKVVNKGGNFDGWLQCTEKMKKLKDLGDWFEYTTTLIEKNTIFASKSSKWEYQPGSTFKFKLDNGQPTIVFDKSFELHYGSDKEMCSLYGTTGVYYYNSNKWLGRGGRVDWSRTGLSVNECYAKLKRYEANTKFPKFSADSVEFVNTKYFKEPILGHLDEHVTMPMDKDKYTFPKFKSYTKNFMLKDIVKNVDYSGSFMMNGNKFLTSDASSSANLIFYRNGKRFLIVNSYKFTIAPEQIYSEKANITIYIDQDSITNSGVSVRYIPANKQVMIINDSKRNYYSPYNNTYHALDMYCESIIWKLDDDILDISMLRQQGAQSFSSFESSDYYTLDKYMKIQGIDQISPLQRVYLYCKKEGQHEFFIDEFSIYIRMDLIQAKQMIHNLAKAGLVTFEEGSGRVTAKDKLFDYVKAYAKAKDIDYDAINLVSATKNTSNAILDLKTNDLRMEGVEKFIVSDSQKVAIYPKDQKIVVKKNRDILFDGYINAGRFEMIVSNSTFLYDQFKLDLPQIDSMWFSVTSFTNPPKWERVKSPINQLVGEILIDAPDNHSSLKRTKDYPIFNSKEKSYVYYDNKAVRIPGYDRKRFFYTLEPFTIKKMLKFETDSLVFAGSLNSAGIFPELKEPLRVQPDYSLGFVMNTPKNGLPMYGGKGHYNKTIDLSYKGFLGQGEVAYLSSVTKSNDIVFLPDSMYAVTDTFYITEQLAGGTDFPDAQIGKANERWYPYRDEMIIAQRSKRDPFRMYHKETQLAGQLTLRPSGLIGSGVATLLDAEITSDTFNMRRTTMDSKRSTFKVRSELFDNWAFVANNVRSSIDYKNRKGDIVSNEEINRVTLPMMNYAAYIDKATWAMDKQELSLKNSKSENTGGMDKLDIRQRVHKGMPGALFVGTSPSLDSLNFYSTEGVFRYNQARLTAKNVFLVYVADAAIAPDGDSLQILAKGKMEKLEKARILADTENKYHLMYDASVDIASRTMYNASAIIDYIDENKKVQKIPLTSVMPNSQGITNGKGVISESDDFKLSPAFRYMGEVDVNAQDKDYLFTGGVQLVHNCVKEGEELGFLRFKGNIDPQHIEIPVDEIPTDSKNNRMTASILFNTDDLKAYSAFLTKDKAADNEILGAAGFLSYDKIRKEYRIASHEKLENIAETPGNYLALKTETCEVYGEGQLNFGIKQNVVKTYSYGSINVNDKKDETDVSMLFGFEFPIAEEALNMMGQYIADDLGLAPADQENPMMRKALMAAMGNEKGEEVYNDYMGSGDFSKIPDVFKHTLFFGNLKWKYLQGFGYYTNGVNTLTSVGKIQIHKKVRTKMQYVKRKSGTYLTIYLQIARDHWYYFHYDMTKHVMLIKSSFVEFDDLIRGAKDREVKTSDGTYRYRLVTNASDVSKFTKKMETFEEGGDDDLYEEEEDPGDNE